MKDDPGELLDIAMDRELVSESFYIAGQNKTQDPGAVQLMKELAEQEHGHYRWIKDFKEKRAADKLGHRENIADLNISEYLTDPGIKDGAGILDVITAAMKREQRSIEFYSQIKNVFLSQEGQELCDRLGHEEMHHKHKLETLYDDLISQEN